MNPRLLARNELFADYMALTRFHYAIGDDQRTIDVLSGPGHDVSIVAVFTLDERGHLSVVFKGGDTRPARTLRREPYVKLGTVGGRLDHSADRLGIAAAEIAEEIGADLIEGTLTPLGTSGSPTMADEATEEDRYYAALVSFADGQRAGGDGEGMELPGLLHARKLEVSDGLAAMQDGRVGEAARAQVAYHRGLSKLGYAGALGGFVDDPRWDTLGLGARFDVRAYAAPVGRPEAPTLGLGGLSMHIPTEIPLAGGARMLEAYASHLGLDLRPVGRRFRVQFLSVPYDRAKVAVFARDSRGHPWVRLRPRLRAGLLAKRFFFEVADGAEPNALDLLEVTCRPDQVTADVRAICAGAFRLGHCADASPGQSDLRQHFFAAEVGRHEGMIPLREAIRAFRTGQGDAAAEAALYRLCDHLGYVPELDVFSRAD